MPAAYPLNSFQPIVPFDGPPTDESIGMLGQVGVDVNTNLYYQKILGKWYTFGDGPKTPVLTTLSAAVSSDNAPANGATSNSVVFTAMDQQSNPMAVTLQIALSSPDAIVGSSTVVTNSSNGQAPVLVKDNVAETVTVTATATDGSGKTANAQVTFVAVQRTTG